MTKRKSIVSKVLLAIVALTLISCCFLGSTFARYTSGGTVSAGTSVALWDVTLDTDGQTDITATKLSPSMSVIGEGTLDADSNRINKTGKILVATLTNGGDVDASVTITVGDETIALRGSVPYDETGYSLSDSTLSGSGASQEQVANLFSIKLYQDDSDTWSDDGAEISGAIDLVAKSGDSATTVYIFAEITWTSTDSQGVLVSDAIDTWAGKNVASVSYAINYTAVQNSEQPNA